MDLKHTSQKSKRPFLTVEGLSKSYEDNQALKAFDLTVYKNDVLGIIGHSGSGKSTLLRLIYGLEDVDEGIIKLENDRVKGRSEVLVPGDDRVKYVKQQYDLFPDHTVYENLEHQIRFHKKEYIKERIHKLLTAFNIEHVKDVKAKQISGGEQQRVAICCALAEAPQLLLLDEPLAHLDQINAKIIKNYLWRFIKTEKITTVFVTHSPIDAMAFSNRILIMKDGQVVEEGLPKSLYFNPSFRYTAEILGACFKFNRNLIPSTYLIKKRGSYFLRPESISLDPEGEFSCDILQVSFEGDRLLVHAKIDKTKIEFYTSNDADIEKGMSTNITIKFDHLIFISG